MVQLLGSDWSPHVGVDGGYTEGEPAWFTTSDCSLVKLVADHSQITPSLGAWWEHQDRLQRTPQIRRIRGFEMSANTSVTL